MSTAQIIDMSKLPPPDVVEALDFEAEFAALKADMKKVGDTLLKEWLDKAGPEGQALVDAFRK